MRSNATTVEQYLGELPEERRRTIEAVRQNILENLPEGYEETMNWGMITYQVPVAICPDTYNKQPLMYAALAAQKNHMAVYLSGIYADDKRREEFEKAYKATGKRYNVGKSSSFGLRRPTRSHQPMRGRDRRARARRMRALRPSLNNQPPAPQGPTDAGEVRRRRSLGN